MYIFVKEKDTVSNQRFESSEYLKNERLIQYLLYGFDIHMFYSNCYLDMGMLTLQNL